MKASVRRWMLAAVVAWCACDISGRVYACFGFDYNACMTFTRMYTDSMGGPLTCWIK